MAPISAVIVGGIGLFLSQWIFYIRLKIILQKNKKIQYDELMRIRYILDSLEKKMYQLERESHRVHQSFKQSQSEIFKWQESLQSQINQGKRTAKSSKA